MEYITTESNANCIVYYNLLVCSEAEPSDKPEVVNVPLYCIHYLVHTLYTTF